MARCNKGRCGREGNYMDFPTHQYIKVDGRRHDLCPDHWQEYRTWLLTLGRSSEVDSGVVDGTDPLKQYPLGYDDFDRLTRWIEGFDKELPKRKSDRGAA